MQTQEACPGRGRKVAGHWSRGPAPSRSAKCPACGRTVGVNYDGTLRRHVARLLRGR